jgi:hypothetical protein
MNSLRKSGFSKQENPPCAGLAWQFELEDGPEIPLARGFPTAGRTSSFLSLFSCCHATRWSKLQPK